MKLTLKYDVEINEWETIQEGTQLEMIQFDEYSGFTGVRYNEKEYYLNSQYFIEIPVLIGK